MGVEAFCCCVIPSLTSPRLGISNETGMISSWVHIVYSMRVASIVTALLQGYTGHHHISSAP